MIKIFLPYQYVIVTLIGFTVMLLLSGFSYKKIATNTLEKSPSKANFYELKAMSIDNEEISFEQFKGKKVLIVNVATKCGSKLLFQTVLQNVAPKYLSKLFSQTVLGCKWSWWISLVNLE